MDSKKVNENLLKEGWEESGILDGITHLMPDDSPIVKMMTSETSWVISDDDEKTNREEKLAFITEESQKMGLYDDFVVGIDAANISDYQSYVVTRIMENGEYKVVVGKPIPKIITTDFHTVKQDKPNDEGL